MRSAVPYHFIGALARLKYLPTRLNLTHIRYSSRKLVLKRRRTSKGGLRPLALLASLIQLNHRNCRWGHSIEIVSYLAIEKPSLTST